MTEPAPKPPLRMLGAVDADACADGFCSIEPAENPPVFPTSEKDDQERPAPE